MRSTSSDASAGLLGRSDVIRFLDIADDHPALSVSPLVRDVDRTLTWIGWPFRYSAIQGRIGRYRVLVSLQCLCDGRP